MNQRVGPQHKHSAVRCSTGRRGGSPAANGKLATASGFPPFGSSGVSVAPLQSAEAEWSFNGPHSKLTN